MSRPAIWGLILSLTCCVLILRAVEAPVPPGHALCVTASCAQEWVRLPDGTP